MHVKIPKKLLGIINELSEVADCKGKKIVDKLYNKRMEKCHKYLHWPHKV